MPPNERPAILEASQELERVYKLVAHQGSSAAPEDPEDEVYYHYICLVRSHKSGKLYELDGDKSGPIDRGNCSEDWTGKSVVQEYIERGEGNLNFNLMALVKEG